ncbi:glucose/arabinose dehydrogenase [Virgibacillus halotolerans]|nr:glucose/arabinose dehydrogenase [Virgibacillus halotolerans]
MTLFVMTTACTQKPEGDLPEHGGESNPEDKEGSESDTLYEPKVVAENLEAPWEIAIQNDIIYMSERGGTIVAIDGKDKQRKKVKLAADLSDQAEAGLLGIAFPEDFSKTNTAFAYYSYHEGDHYYQRVVTIKETDEDWEETSVILDQIPGGEFHQGGRIKIGPDNKLYVTTGDATNPGDSQDLDSLAGKILRLNLDGSVPDDNPFEDSYVYSYGHRNAQGLAWDDKDQLYATEHGDNAHDEINRIEAGKNYGWPNIEGDETADDMESPIIQSGEDTWAPSGMTFLRGQFFFASLKGEGLRRFDPKNEKVDLIISDVGRVRDAHATEDGIYIITNNTDGRGNPTDADDRLIFIPHPKNKLF